MTTEQYKKKLRKEVEGLKQDENPRDPFTGEAVETYGYEATHNQALDDVLALIDKV